MSSCGCIFGEKSFADILEGKEVEITGGASGKETIRKGTILALTFNFGARGCGYSEFSFLVLLEDKEIMQAGTGGNEKIRLLQPEKPE